MRPVLLLLFGAHISLAKTHSLKYFYTGVSGIDFPEFTAAGLVDEEVFMYFDSNTKRAEGKTDWIRQNKGADYWDTETQTDIGQHQVFKNNIQILKERFNQTQGVHTVQRMYGCEWDDQTGETKAFNQYGYDGEDFLILDLKELSYITPVQQGFITAQKLNNDRGLIEGHRKYFNSVCIEWLMKYLEYGKSSLKKTVSPQVSLLQKSSSSSSSSSSSVSCHATGFYPSGITITWMKNGEDLHEDVDLGELLPNGDGTFQKTSTIRVSPEEWRKNKFSCEVEHQGKTVREDEIRTNRASLPIGLFVGVAVAVLLLMFIVIVRFVLYRKMKDFKPVDACEKQIPEISPKSLEVDFSSLPIPDKNKRQSSMNSDLGYDSNSDSLSDCGSHSDVRSDSGSEGSADSTTSLIRRDSENRK